MCKDVAAVAATSYYRKINWSKKKNLQESDFETTLLWLFCCAMLSGFSWTTLHKVFSCAIVPRVLRHHWTGFFPVHIWSLLDNIAQDFCLCNVSPWPTENFIKKVPYTMLYRPYSEKHCIGILSSQYYPNTSETTLRKKDTCSMLVQSAQTCFCR